MADLSNLLGAVYGESSPTEDRDPDGPPTPVEPAAHERTPAVPEWADDEHLDDAFAQWKPGPPDDAPAVEREIMAGEPISPLPLADDLAAALSEALVAVDDEQEPDDEDSVHTFAAPQVHDIDEVHEVRDVHDVHDVHDVRDDDEVEFDRKPHVTPERAAAAELAATTRHVEDLSPDAQHVPDIPPVPPLPPVPSVEPTPAAAVMDLPYADDDHSPAPAPETATSEPASPRRWQRSDDDILPTKGGGGKKFFSLSLRRG